MDKLSRTRRHNPYISFVGGCLRYGVYLLLIIPRYSRAHQYYFYSLALLVSEKVVVFHWRMGGTVAANVID